MIDIVPQRIKCTRKHDGCSFDPIRGLNEFNAFPSSGKKKWDDLF